MKKGLVETSSIFSKDRYVEEPAVEKEKVMIDSIALEEEKGIPLCRVISFDPSDANIALKDFFPDSLHCIIYNKFFDCFFAGHMGEELIFEVPIVNYEILFTTADMVVLLIIDKRLEEDSEPRYMLLKDGSYDLLSSLTLEDETKEYIQYDARRHDFESTEIQSSTISATKNINTFYYKDGDFIKDADRLLFVNKKDNVKILLADKNGSYIGYYLKLNQDDSVNLHGRSFNILKRLTLALVVVEDIETEERFLLSCANQMLFNLELFGMTDYENIPILNGVALLYGRARNGEVLNIFTPNHQRIILEPKYKVNTDIVGNGLYFEKDNVLLLDNGSLIFTERLSKTLLKIKGREVKIPTEYYGDL